jgi:hypothetical protein
MTRVVVGREWGGIKKGTGSGISTSESILSGSSPILLEVPKSIT